MSIIICTHNRAESLRETLAAIGKCHVPADLPTELLVVANACTDDTAKVVESAALTNLPVRCVDEPRKGKGYAYNTGMAAARGEVFLFTDDDVRPPREWIDRMCRPIVKGEADLVQGGVRLAPHLERKWLSRVMREMVASTELKRSMDPVVNVISANMGFSRRVLERVPAFDVELGPGALGFGDDTLFGYQLRAAGYRLIGCWDACVEHHFDAGRLSRHAFLDIAQKMGRSIAYIDYHFGHCGKTTGLSRIWVLLVLGLVWLLDVRTWFGQIPSDLETRRVRKAAWLSYMDNQRGKPRKYRRHGLVKLKGAEGPEGEGLGVPDHVAAESGADHAA